MDNELIDLEAELKRLRPVAPSAFAKAKVEQALVRPRRAILAWAALPLAAAVAVMVVVKEKTPTSAPVAATPVQQVAPVAVVSMPTRSATAYKPVSAKNVLYDLTDEGLVTLSDGTTARRYRTSYVDTITWKNPRTQASLRWSVPRTEERVVPVSFQ